MRIWIDADACPGAVKEIVLRAVQRLQVPVVFVANAPLNLPRSPLISTVQVGKGLDVADLHIAEQAEKGDLAVTHDIPLAAALVKKGVVTMDPRGELFTEESIDERLSVRDFMQELRESGVMSGGPKSFGPQDKQRFAATFDREIGRLVRR
ncbi:YaiI/YqxD family protein [Vulgatibacter sp.]|uniref:YaiI/YqxD family protein n=1 Tax=Vulgatibacter sp. TaxID=1971226 RepID=UPI00356B49FF